MSSPRDLGIALFAACLWGIWWLPLRELEALGLDGTEAAFIMNASALLAIAFLRPWRSAHRLGRTAMLGAFIFGVSVTAYSLAVYHGEVVRVVLLFYLAPVWSKLIERIFLNQPWGWVSTLALVLSFGGIVVLVGEDIGSGNVSFIDAVALLSGLAWAVGSAMVFSSQNSSTSQLYIFTTLTTVLLTGAGLLLFPETPLSDAPASAWGWGVVAGVAFFFPLMFLTLLSATRLPPATLSFLLSAEIITGVGTSAIFLDEPFGIRHAIGAALVTLGALAEVVFAPRRSFRTKGQGTPDERV